MVGGEKIWKIVRKQDEVGLKRALGALGPGYLRGALRSKLPTSSAR